MPRSASETLDRLEADDFALLFECRWSKKRRDEVLPILTRLARHRDRDIRHRAMWAVHRIGHCFRKGAMKATVPEITRNMQDKNLLTRKIATGTLIAVGGDNPAVAVPALVEAAKENELLVPAMQALIGIGVRARKATPVFQEAATHSQAKIRCLAIRGLGDVATLSEATPTLELAMNDRSQQVRDLAAKVLQCKRGK